MSTNVKWSFVCVWGEDNLWGVLTMAWEGGGCIVSLLSAIKGSQLTLLPWGRGERIPWMEDKLTRGLQGGENRGCTIFLQLKSVGWSTRPDAGLIITAEHQVEVNEQGDH